MAGFLSTKNDRLINLLVIDKNYRILSSGEVWTLVSRSGRKSKDGNWRRLVPLRSSSGHLWLKYKYTRLALHRVIFRKFKGELNDLLVVNHIDGDKENNTPKNLELITNSENMIHCFRVLKRIPLKPRKKISQQIADQIREESHSGLTNKQLREKFHLSKSSISYIINGKTWKPKDAPPLADT